MSKSTKTHIDSLYEWLSNNKIQYEILDKDTISIPDFGKVYYQDTEMSKYKSIFRKNKDDEYIFNSMEEPEVLLNDGINYIAFKFGNNYYYTDLRQEFKLNILKYIGKRTEPQNKVEFVNLGVHTPFELLNGSFMPNMWVHKAKYLGHNALGICDKNTMAGCFTLQKECLSAGITPVFGYSLTFDDGETKVEGKVYAQTQEGYRNLLRIQKAIMVDNVENKTISLSELLVRGKGNAFVFGKLSSQYIAERKDVVAKIFDAFERVYYQVDLSEYKANRIDIKVLEATKYYFDNVYDDDTQPGPILISDCYYLDQDDAKNKVILNKVAEGAAHEQSNDQYFKDIDEHYAKFQELFSDDWDIDALFKECCEATIEIASHSEVKMDTTKNFMPKYDMTEEEKAKYGTTHNMFNCLIEEGLNKLIPADKQDKYRKQVEYEKYIIESTDNVDYLLVQYDTCNWARRNGILVGCGRGSAAGCLLLYLLGITLIDPMKYSLIFERFLIPERAGLAPTSTTIIGEDIESNRYVEVSLDNGKLIKVDADAQLLVKRNGNDEPITIYADQLLEGDDIVLDNRDLLFTINEI